MTNQPNTPLITPTHNFTKPHEFSYHDYEVERGKKFCACGLPEDNPLHTVKGQPNTPDKNTATVGQCEWSVVGGEVLGDARVYANVICKRHGEVKRVKIKDDQLRVKDGGAEK